MTNKSWVASRRKESVSQFAAQDWDSLLKMRGMGRKKVRGLIEILLAGMKR